MAKSKYNKNKKTEKIGSDIDMTTTIITKADALDDMLDTKEEIVDETLIVPEKMVVMPKKRDVIGEVTSTDILVIDRINGFTYVKSGNLRKQYSSVQYKLNNPYNPTSAVVSADGIDIGVLAIEFIGKEKHQLSDVEMDEQEEERLKKENFVVKG